MHTQLKMHFAYCQMDMQSNVTSRSCVWAKEKGKARLDCRVWAVWAKKQKDKIVSAMQAFPFTRSLAL